MSSSNRSCIASEATDGDDDGPVDPPEVVEAVSDLCRFRPAMGERTGTDTETASGGSGSSPVGLRESCSGSILGWRELLPAGWLESGPSMALL